MEGAVDKCAAKGRNVLIVFDSLEFLTASGLSKAGLL